MQFNVFEINFVEDASTQFEGNTFSCFARPQANNWPNPSRKHNVSSSAPIFQVFQIDLDAI